MSVVIDIALGGPIRRWWTNMRKQSRCFHHDIHDGTSFITQLGIIDYRRAWECSRCNKIWIM